MYCDKMKTTVIYVLNMLFLFFMLFMKMKIEIYKLICILFVHLSSIILENFKDIIFIIPEIFEFFGLHTYKFGLVYIKRLTPEYSKQKCRSNLHMVLYFFSTHSTLVVRHIKFICFDK